MRKLALVLGGGASKGFTHIGILKVLEKNGIVPDLIVGTSMGALIGGVYSVGVSIEKIEEMAKKFNKIGNFSLISALFKDNILNINNAKKIITQNFGNKTHKDCNIKFMCVATNMKTGKEQVFSSGLLKETVMASISIPAVFPRVKIGDNIYCDGGLVNNLPEDVVKNLNEDYIILSVDPIGDYSKQVEKCKMKTVEALLNASTIMTTNVVKNKPMQADLRLTLSMPSVSQLDFSFETTNKAIHKGELVMKKHLQELKNLLNN